MLKCEWILKSQVKIFFAVIEPIRNYILTVQGGQEQPSAWQSQGGLPTDVSSHRSDGEYLGRWLRGENHQHEQHFNLEEGRPVPQQHGEPNEQDGEGQSGEI